MAGAVRGTPSHRSPDPLPSAPGVGRGRERGAAGSPGRRGAHVAAAASGSSRPEAGGGTTVAEFCEGRSVPSAICSA